MFGIQFYPTPPTLVKKMIGKLTFPKDTKSISLLEPSAGKGNIVDGFKEYFINKENNYYDLKRIKPKGTPKVERLDFAMTKEEFVGLFQKRFAVRLDTVSEMDDWLDNNINTDDEYYEVCIHHYEPNKDIKYMINCIEIDKDLCSVLNGKHYFTKSVRKTHSFGSGMDSTFFKNYCIKHLTTYTKYVII